MGRKKEFDTSWRKRNPQKRNEERKRYYDKTANAPRYKCKWTEEEMDMLFSSKLTDTELSKEIERSVASIQIMRCRLNKEERL